uniref:Uncharacterized protein n=1 Tax=Mycena chlorophos TaxID=658473 RepID=A0ABQ0LD25_MYCCL|nr:predicted protein [Mycena chlorophos]
MHDHVDVHNRTAPSSLFSAGTCSLRPQTSRSKEMGPSWVQLGNGGSTQLWFAFLGTLLLRALYADISETANFKPASAPLFTQRNHHRNHHAQESWQGCARLPTAAVTVVNATAAPSSTQTLAILAQLKTSVVGQNLKGKGTLAMYEQMQNNARKWLAGMQEDEGRDENDTDATEQPANSASSMEFAPDNAIPDDLAQRQIQFTDPEYKKAFDATPNNYSPAIVSYYMVYKHLMQLVSCIRCGSMPRNVIHKIVARPLPYPGEPGMVL